MNPLTELQAKAKKEFDKKYPELLEITNWELEEAVSKKRSVKDFSITYITQAYALGRKEGIRESEECVPSFIDNVREGYEVEDENFDLGFNACLTATLDALKKLYSSKE